MNDAHLHMIVNHFPIIGTIFGLGILFTGVVLKNNSVKNTAYVLFIVAAIFAAFSMGTGDGAEDVAEKLPGVTKEIIHEHEELAEKFALLLYALGVVSLVGIFLNVKNHTKAKLVSWLAIVIAAVALFLAKEVGTSGGEVRHTEIRTETIQPAGAEQNAVTGEQRGKEDED